MEAETTTDVGRSPFEPWPAGAEVHVEWGPTGARLAGERGDLVVIVDVLAFSTSVVLAVSRGATVLAHSAAELDALGGRGPAAAALDAEIVAKDRAATTARFSLSPASLTAVRPGDRLVFTSLNGAACTAAAKGAPFVLIGALTNRTAVAATIRRVLASGRARRCTIVACGERWTSVAPAADGLRPGIEDLLGAGSIAAALADLRRSPEAAVAAASFDAVAARVAEVVRASTSGRELVERGFPDDVALAVRVDSLTTVPCWDTRRPRRELTDAVDVL